LFWRSELEFILLLRLPLFLLFLLLGLDFYRAMFFPPLALLPESIAFQLFGFHVKDWLGSLTDYFDVFGLFESLIRIGFCLFLPFIFLLQCRLWILRKHRVLFKSP